MTLAEAIAAILGPKLAHDITMSQGQHWALVAAIADARMSDDQEALAVLRAYVAEQKARDKTSR